KAEEDGFRQLIALLSDWKGSAPEPQIREGWKLRLSLALEPLSAKNAWLFWGSAPPVLSDLRDIDSNAVSVRAGSAPDNVPLPIPGMSSRLRKSAMDSWLGKHPLPNPSNQAHVYVPTLRGLRPHGGADIYRSRTIGDYFDKFEDLKALKASDTAVAGDKRILTGLSLYEHVHSLMIGEPFERKHKRDWEAFLGHRVFGGQTIEITPRKTHSMG